MPAVGLDRHTGAPLVGFDGAVQRLDRLWSTRIGSYPMFREYGSITAELLGKRITPSLIAIYRYGLWLAADTYEPCVQVSRVILGSQQVETLRLGELSFEIGLLYLPNGHLGDRTVEGGLRRVAVGGDLTRTNARIIRDTA